MTMIPDTRSPSNEPIFVTHTPGVGVSYVPGHDFAEVAMAANGRILECSAADALRLVSDVLEALNDPRAESRRIAARVARLGEGGGPRGA